MLAWVQSKRDDCPALNLIGKEELNLLELEIKRYAEGAPVPSEEALRLESKPPASSTRGPSPESRGETSPPEKPAKPAKPPPEKPVKAPPSVGDGEMSAQLLKELSPVEDRIREAQYREAVAYMAGSLLKRCRKLEKEDPTAMDWEDLLHWVKAKRKQYPGLNVVGQKQLDSLESSINDAIGKQRKAK
jgi:hypothetical protein